MSEVSGENWLNFIKTLKASADKLNQIIVFCVFLWGTFMFNYVSIFLGG